MGGCIARIFKDQGHGQRRALRTTTTARYGTGAAAQSAAFTGGSSSRSSRGYKCEGCGARFQSLRDLDQHKRTVHGGKVRRPKKPKAAPVDTTTQPAQPTRSWDEKFMDDEVESAVERIAERRARERGGRKPRWHQRVAGAVGRSVVSVGNRLIGASGRSSSSASGKKSKNKSRRGYDRV